MWGVCLGLYKALAHCDCCEAMHACVGVCDWDCAMHMHAVIAVRRYMYVLLCVLMKTWCVLTVIAARRCMCVLACVFGLVQRACSR